MFLSVISPRGSLKDILRVQKVILNIAILHYVIMTYFAPSPGVPACTTQGLGCRDKVLVLLPSYSSKLLPKWQGLFMVTRWVGNVDYEVVGSDRGEVTQVYQLNLLKARRGWNCFPGEPGEGERWVAPYIPFSVVIASSHRPREWMLLHCIL